MRGNRRHRATVLILGLIVLCHLFEVSSVVKQLAHYLALKIYNETLSLVNPAAIGNAMAIFKALDGYQKMLLESSAAFSCGIVVNKYRKAS